MILRNKMNEEEKQYDMYSCRGSTSYKKSNGKCRDCHYPTVDGKAQISCNWAPLTCKTCERHQCEGDGC
jgi:hypothetical protein